MLVQVAQRLALVDGVGAVKTCTSHGDCALVQDCALGGLVQVVHLVVGIVRIILLLNRRRGARQVECHPGGAVGARLHHHIVGSDALVFEVARAQQSVVGEVHAALRAQAEDRALLRREDSSISFEVCHIVPLAQDDAGQGQEVREHRQLPGRVGKPRREEDAEAIVRSLENLKVGSAPGIFEVAHVIEAALQPVGSLNHRPTSGPARLARARHVVLRTEQILDVFAQESLQQLLIEHLCAG
mmetsp:Transcript_103438/g.331637  ORF Transcript_103438/g.331637 Transcript_103438/m.331637 type:complete len:242 (-) Transcript_103438:960-1685(-)